MLIVSTETPKPFWLDASKLAPPLRSIPGFKVFVHPITVAMKLAARTAAARARQTLIEDLGLQIPDDPEEAGKFLLAHPKITAAAEAEYTTYLAVEGIIQWEGVGGPNKKPIAPSEQAVRAVMQKQRVYDFLDRNYVGPALIEDDEKNASSPSRNTTSPRAKRTAKAAGKPAAEAAPSALTS